MYTITVPNGAYDEVFLGCQFADGTTTTLDASVAAAARFLGYTVDSDTPEDSRPAETLTEAPPAVEPVKPARKRAPARKAAN